MLNKTQFGTNTEDHFAEGGTMTLEAYKARAAAGHAPDTLNGPDPANSFWKPRNTQVQSAAAENRREAKAILGLRNNDSQYGAND